LRQLLNQAKQTLDLDNKGQIADLPATVTAFVVIVFVLGIGAVMVTALRDTDTVEQDGISIQHNRTRPRSIRYLWIIPRNTSTSCNSRNNNLCLND